MRCASTLEIPAALPRRLSGRCSPRRSPAGALRLFHTDVLPPERSIARDAAFRALGDLRADRRLPSANRCASGNYRERARELTKVCRASDSCERRDRQNRQRRADPREIVGVFATSRPKGALATALLNGPPRSLCL